MAEIYQEYNIVADSGEELGTETLYIYDKNQREEALNMFADVVATEIANEGVKAVYLTLVNWDADIQTAEQIVRSYKVHEIKEI